MTNSDSSSDAIAILQSALSMDHGDLAIFVSNLETEISKLKAALNLPSKEYSPTLVKLLYEISNDSRQTANFFAWERDRTEQNDRWILNKLENINLKLHQAKELLN